MVLESGVFVDDDIFGCLISFNERLGVWNETALREILFLDASSLSV